MNVDTMLTSADKKVAKSGEKWHCLKCDYSTDKKNHWEKHLETKKHNADKMLTSADKKWQKVASPNKVSESTCLCGKSFMHRQSLSRHKKKCQFINKLDNNDDQANLLNEIMKAQKNQIDFNNKMVDLLQISKMNYKNKSECSIGTQNNNCGIGTQNFNINLFLNEKCSDAQNIQDFMNQLKVTFKDIMSESKNSIPNLLINGVSPLSITERPIHCSDVDKKEFYIKDKENGWQGPENGNHVINETQKKLINKIQSNFELEKINDDQYLKSINNATSELNDKEKINMLEKLGEKILINNDILSKI